MKHETREAWLNALVQEMADWYDGTLPPVRIGVGFTSKGIRSVAIGQCWTPEASADGVIAIFVHPALDDPSRVADVVAHELIHALIGCDEKHGPVFKRAALALGLEGKMTATTAGARFLERIAPVLDKLGPYPHGALTGGGSSAKPKQPTRMLKVSCPGSIPEDNALCPTLEEDGTSYTVRTTRKWIDSYGCPACPACGTTMTEAAA
jgi:hypothetical protein